MSTIISFLLIGFVLIFCFSTYSLVKHRRESVDAVVIESQLPHMEAIDIESQVPEISLEAPTKNDRPYEEYKISRRVQAPRFMRFEVLPNGKIECVFKCYLLDCFELIQADEASPAGSYDQYA
ncbi:hypothetical protein GQ457_13G027830 [Hibiscus cannabinus]